MLSKSANSLYLLARYIERAESLSRIINTNSQHLIDGLTNNISEKSYWSTIYSIFPDEKPLNNTNITLDVFCQSSFEFSIKNSIKKAREHGRIVRDLISDDMWLELNSLYLYVTAQKGNIDLDNCPSDYFGRVQNSTLLCNGILNSTIERNETWVFYQIGLFLERAEITTRVLSLQFEFSSNDLSYIWNNTLDSCNARSAYHQKYGSDINNFNLCDLLVLSSTFPKSIKFCISKIYKKNPRDISNDFINLLNKNKSISKLCKSLEIAGPGFINIKLKDEVLINEIKSNIQCNRAGIPLIREDLDSGLSNKVIVDFSSPNIAKEMHVGHLRSTIIGDSISRIFELRGYEVLRLNHVGDWGTQFGMLITQLKDLYSNDLEEIGKIKISDLVEFYKESKKRFDNESEFQKRSREEVVKLQSGDIKSIKAWKLLCDQSRKEFDEIYKNLKIKIEERGESFYNPFLKSVIDDLSLSELNDQIERVEDEFYRVFNLSIEEEHLKVECADWTPTGTHIAQRACQPHFLTQARNQNLRDWNNQMDVIASPEQLRVRLAAEFEELTAAINEVLEENQYFRELNAILRMLRERTQEID